MAPSIAFLPDHHVAHLVTDPPVAFVLGRGRTACGRRITRRWRMVSQLRLTREHERLCVRCMNRSMPGRNVTTGVRTRR